MGPYKSVLAMPTRGLNRETVVSGTILVGAMLDQLEGTVVIRDGRIAAIEEGRTRSGLWIIPAFFNAHTHLGDTIALDYPAKGDLKALVTPPDGIKHRLLSATPASLIREAIQASVRTMEMSGTAGFADFREGGTDGVKILREAVRESDCQAVILGREGGELIADGLGVSSVRDVPDVEDRVRSARAAGKKIAFHAGETDPHDIDAAISLEPDLLVHCTHATRTQLRECAERQIPIAVCARSNWRLGVTSGPEHPPLREMIQLGCRVLLGTDNAMFVSPDLFREMSFISTVYRVEPRLLLQAAVSGSGVFHDQYWIHPGHRASLLILDPSVSNLRFSHDITATIVNRATESLIVKKVFSPKERNV